MKIAIIGAGNVGGALGLAWAKAGHEVMFGVRAPASLKVTELLAKMPGHTRAGSVSDAAAFGDVVVLCTPWNSVEAALREAGDLSGKVVIDCTNPLTPELSGLSVGRTSSGAELVAGWVPGAQVVKAFNTIGFENMAEPNLNGRAITLLIAGGDEAASSVVCNLARQIGFDPVNTGPLAMARLLEPMALLWIKLAVFQGYGTRIAFQLEKKHEPGAD